MTVEQEVANLTTSVDQLADAVNVKKQTLDASVADSETARNQSQDARDAAQAAEQGAQSAASTAQSHAADAALAEQGAQTALADAQEVAYGTDPVFETIRVTGEADVPAVTSARAQLGQLASSLGQVVARVDDVAAAQDGGQTLTALASAIGQLSQRVSGGQIELRGGTLDDPALRIGSVGIYSAAADTLSVAIAGTEVARLDASGLTIYGTVTEQ